MGKKTTTGASGRGPAATGSKKAVKAAPVPRSKSAATKKTLVAKSKRTSAEKTSANKAKLLSQPCDNEKQTKMEMNSDDEEEGDDETKAGGDRAMTPETRRKLIWVLLNVSFECSQLDSKVRFKDAVQRGGRRLVRTWDIPEESAPRFVRLLPAKVKGEWMVAYIDTRMESGDYNLDDGECRSLPVWSKFAPVVKAWEPTEEEAIKYMQAVADDEAEVRMRDFGDMSYNMMESYRDDEHDEYMCGYNDEKAADPLGHHGDEDSSH